MKLNTLIKPLFIFTAIVLTLILLIVSFQKNIDAAAVPTVNINLPSNEFLGDTVNFSVSFSNTGADEGYGPFVDVIFPFNGADGVSPYDPTFEADGLSYVSANYGGEPVVTTVQSFPDDGFGTGCVDHPYAVDTANLPVAVCGVTGDQLVTVQLPFGSFVSDQPDAVVNFTASLSEDADLNEPLEVYATGGFEFGEDPLRNPSTDPSLYDAYDSSMALPSSWDSASIEPKVVEIEKSDSISENETATGPNFVRTYRIEVEVADGQTIGVEGDGSENVVITDRLPNNIIYNGNESFPADCSVTVTPSSIAPNNPPNNELEFTCDSLTGTGSSFNFGFDYYVAYTDADSNLVINEASGDDVTYENDVEISASWVPTDPDDTTEIFVLDETPVDDSSVAKSIATQKSGSIVSNVGPSTVSPGDTIEFTLNFQISDFFTLDDLIFTDILSDGLRFDTSFTPTRSFNEHGTSYTTTDFQGANYTVIDHFTGAAVPVAPIDGTQEIIFDLSQDLDDDPAPYDGMLVGGCVPQSGTTSLDNTCSDFNSGSRTTGNITFRAIVQEDFSDDPGDLSVDQGDVITNNITVDASIIDNNDLSTVLGTESDGSSWSSNITSGDLSKTIYAINDNTSFSASEISPGDKVTYRFEYTLPTADFEDLSLTDYFPLPVFSVNDPNQDAVANGIAEWSFDYTADASVPAAGEVKFGPTDSFYALSQSVLPPNGVQPSLAIDTTANSLDIVYGTFDDPDSLTSKIDILVSIVVSDEPFGNGLQLTNQVIVQQSNTSLEAVALDTLVQVELLQPNVVISKGAVASDNTNAEFVDDSGSVIAPYAGSISISAPGSACSRIDSGIINSNALDSNPIEANIRNIDVADTITYAIVLENIGDSPNGAFDVSVSDSLPTGVSFVPGSLCVVDGTGTVASYTALNGADTNPLFETGIEIDDPGTTATPTGGLDPNDPSNGENIIVVFYDVTIDSGAEVLEEFENEASLLSFAGNESATNHIPDPIEAYSTATVADLSMVKSIVDTDISATATTGNNVAIGEVVEYQIDINIPEAQISNPEIVDTLDSGLAFVECVSIVSLTDSISSTDIEIDSSTTYSNFCDDPTNPVITSDGRIVTFDFGSLLENTNTDNTVEETLRITYRAVVLELGNSRGDLLNNNVELSFTDWLSNPRTFQDSTDNLTVQEPDLEITKSFSIGSADANDIVGVTLTITNNSITNSTTAYEVEVQDSMPTYLSYDSGINCSDNNGNQTSCAESAGTVSATWSSLAPGESETITFDTIVSPSVPIGDSIYNSAALEGTSVSGNPGTISSYNTNSIEETYNTSGDDTLNILSANPDKFIVSTSEAHTTDISSLERVTIGEIVRYRLEVRIAESTTDNLQLRDNLPDGLQFLNDGTATAALVSDLDSITSTIVAPAAALTGNDTNIDSLTPTYVLPDSAVSTSASTNDDTYGNGTDVYFKFGDVVNSEDDSNAEFILVEFNALVLNNASNNAGNNKVNTFNLFVDGSSIASSTNLVRNRVSIVEPNITLNKTIETAPEDASDTITYRFEISNGNTNSDSDAFDLNFTDTLDSNLTFDLYTLISSPGYATVTNNSVGSNLDIDIDELRKGDSVIFEVDATVGSTVIAGTQISNTADVIYTSLPNANGSTGNATGSDTPGASGTTSGERNGTSGGSNDYEESDSANTQIGIPEIDKLGTPLSGAIGDLNTFSILVTLPEGVSSDLVINDIIPPYLRYESVNVITDSSLSTSLTADFSGTLGAPSVSGGASAGEDVSFDFGDVTVPGNAIADDQSFVLEVTTRITNSINLQRTDTQTNTANLEFTEPVGSTTQTVNDPNGGPVVTILEPILETDKVISTLPSPLDAGSVISYEIDLEHATNSDSDAFDIILTDQIPANTTISNVVVTAVGISNPSYEVVGSTLRVPNTSDNSFDLPLGATVSITYDVTLQQSIRPLEEITNDVSAVWSSTDGSNPDERTSGTGLYDTSESGTNGLDDYEVTDSVTTTADGVSIDKLPLSQTNYTIGDFVTYEILVTLPEGTIDELILTDELPNGMSYDSFNLRTFAASSSLTSDFNGSISSPSVTGGSSDGEDVVFDFGTVTTTADGIDTNNSFILEVVATVLNIDDNQRGVSLDNTASLTFENPNDSSTESVSDPTPVTISLIEPILDISKSVVSAPSLIEAGSVITYEVELTHNANSAVDAFNTFISDVALGTDATISNVSITAVSLPTPSYEITGSNELIIPNSVDAYFYFPLGASLTITYDVTLGGSVNANDTLVNLVNATWYSQSIIANPNARSGEDGSYDLTESSANGTNDYSVSGQDSSLIVSGPGVTKLLGETNNPYTADTPSPSQVAIGEQITFFLRTQFIEGTTNQYTVEDQIPDNLVVTGVNLITSAADSYGHMSADFNGTIDSFSSSTTAGDGNDIEFILNDVAVPNDGIGTNNFIGIEVIAIVDDAAINDSGATFSNSASGQLDSDPAEPGGSLDFETVEPVLDISKEFGSVVDADEAYVSQVVTTNILVENTGNTDAFDLVITDNLDGLSPNRFAYVASSLQITCSALVTDSFSVSDASNPILAASIERLPDGESCEISFDSEITDQSVDADVISNGVSITEASSMPGVNTEERDLSGASDTDDITIITPDLEITKSSAVTNVNTGDILVYDLEIENIGDAPATEIVVTETLPEYTSFNAANSTPGWNCVLSNCTFDFDAFRSNSEFTPADGSETIQFAVLIETVEQGVSSIDNSASVADNGLRGTDPTPANNTDTESDTFDGVPDIAITKTDNDISVLTGEIITYVLEYENIGDRGATNVTITETIPLETQFIAAASTPGFACTPDDQAGSSCELNVGTLNPGDSGSVEFSIEVLGFYPDDLAQVENTVLIADDGTNGVDSDLSNNEATETTPLLYTNVFDPPSALKTYNDDGLPEIEWKMVWINDGNTIAQNVFIFDEVPDQTTYVANSFECEARGDSITISCEFNATDNQVEWIGEIAPDLGGTTEDDSDNEVVLSFRTTVPDSVNELSNQAEVHWDGDGDGDYLDDILAGQVAYPSDDPTTEEAIDPTQWVRPELAETGVSSTGRAYIALGIGLLTILVASFNPSRAKLAINKLVTRL